MTTPRRPAIWSDDETLWVVENAASGADRVFAYDLISGEHREDKGFEFERRNRFSHGIWSDRTTVWIADSGRDMLFAYILRTRASGCSERDIDVGRAQQGPARHLVRR